MPDATVVALSRRFLWVEVNKDHPPGDAIAKRFNVSAYPSFITINRKQEKIYRFSAYMKPPQFVGELNEALRRWNLYRAGQEWDDPASRPETICDQGTVETVRAPGSGVSGGIAVHGGDLLLAQWPDRLPGSGSDEGREPSATLYRLDLATGAVKGKAPISTSIADVCSDGRTLFAVESGWTAGFPIHEIDVATGTNVRAIVTEENKKNKSYGAKGIACHRDRLFVLDGMPGTIHEVDKVTGGIVRTLTTGEKWLAGLAVDGDLFVAGSRTAIFWINPESGQVVRKVPVNYQIRSIEAHGGAIYIMEQPVFGYDKEHRWIQVWPRPSQTVIYKLRPHTLPSPSRTAPGSRQGSSARRAPASAGRAATATGSPAARPPNPSRTGW